VFYGITVDNADQTFKSILLIFYTLLILWNIAIIAHILRHAIDKTFGFGILLAIGYIMITAIVIVIMLPDQGIS
jgi:galactitol-specific phosphotransferase system IIC component